MPVSARTRARLSRGLPSPFIVLLLAASAVLCPAAAVRGVVTDPSGAKVPGANVALLSNGKVVATAISMGDGSFQILTGTTGRFFLVVSAKSFRQVETPGFYAGALDNIERNVVLEPEWVRESIVVTATGTPTPQAQTSAATSVLGPLDLALRDDLVSALRLMPGTFVVQSGQMGASASLFVRGGDSTSNKVLVDGVYAGDLGGGFDFGRSPLQPSRGLRSIVDRTRISMAPMLPAASSASPPRMEPRAFLLCSSTATQAVSKPRVKSLK